MELVVHAAGGMIVLCAAMVLGIYKPRGVLSDGVLPRWVKVSALVVVTFGALGALAAHLAAGHTRHLASPG